MEAIRDLAELLLAELRTAFQVDLTLERLDRIHTEAERLLLACAAMCGNDTVQEQLPHIQLVLRWLDEITGQLQRRECGYEPGYYTFEGRGRPRVNISREMLSYFFDHGFTAPQVANLLHTSLSNVRRRMSMYGISVTAQYSTISDVELERLILSIQDHYPQCGYRMMIGHLFALRHRIQELRVRKDVTQKV
jgi:hypothetical protein